MLGIAVLAIFLIEKDKITGDNIYKILLNFENIFSNMDDLERKQFIELLIDEIQIHPEKQENGQWLKSISFKLPIIDQDFDINGWVNNTHVSTWLETTIALTQNLDRSLIGGQELVHGFDRSPIGVREHFVLSGTCRETDIYLASTILISVASMFGLTSSSPSEIKPHF